MFFYDYINVKENAVFFQRASWKRHCATHWREQRGWDLVIFDWFVLSMRMQVILDSSFARPNLVPRASFPLTSGRKTWALGATILKEQRDRILVIRLTAHLHLWRMPEMVAPRALVFRPLVKGNEALGTRLRTPGFSPYMGREERRVQGLDYLWCGDFISTFREEDHFILEPGILRHPLGLSRSVSLSVEKLRDRISFVIRVTNTRG